MFIANFGHCKTSAIISNTPRLIIWFLSFYKVSYSNFCRFSSRDYFINLQSKAKGRIIYMLYDVYLQGFTVIIIIIIFLFKLFMDFSNFVFFYPSSFCLLLLLYSVFKLDDSCFLQQNRLCPIPRQKEKIN